MTTSRKDFLRLSAATGGALGLGLVPSSVEAARPDVLYLDIQLGADSGFDVIDVPRSACKVS